MHFNCRLLTIFVVLELSSAACAALATDAESPNTKPLFERSKDTHAIDVLPPFDIPAGEAPFRTVEKAAQRQIEDSIDADRHDAVEPNTGGSVMVTTRQKINASRESTEIGNSNPQNEGTIPLNEKVHRPTVALALGGGGARGAAHIGVLRVLKAEGIPIDYIVGNSMGSIVGGLYAAGVPLEDIEEIMVNGKLGKSYMPGWLPPKLLISPLAKLMHPIKKHYAGLWTGKKFARFLERQLPEGIHNVEDTPIPFSAVATNLIDGKAYRISDGRLSSAIRASSSIPPLLQPVAIGDKVYVDGGVRANMPASAARDTGADVVIAILVDEPLQILPATRFQNLKGIVERLGDILLAVSDARQLPFADIIINPDVSGLPVLKGTAADARKAILAGETAARAALPVIRNKLSASTRMQ